MNASPAQPPLDPALALLQRVWELAHALERMSCQMERTLGMTALQRFILGCVGQCPGMTVGQLAELLNLNRDTVHSALLRLEKLRLLKRRRDTRDGQRVTLDLTPKGRAMTVLRSGTDESAVLHLLESSNKSEIEITRSVLRRLAEGLADEAVVTLQRL